MELAIAVATGLLLGIIAALKVIAPKTKNTFDDKVLDLAEKVEPAVESLTGVKQ